MPRSRSLRPVSAASELSVEEGYGLVDGDDMCGRKWVRQQRTVNEPSGESSMVTSTFAGPEQQATQVCTANDLPIGWNDHESRMKKPES